MFSIHKKNESGFDNIILKNDDPADPVLVDFGISFAGSAAKEDDHETKVGQELGNRAGGLIGTAAGAPGNDELHRP